MEIVNKFKKVTALVVIGLLMLGLVPGRGYAAEEVHVFTKIVAGGYHNLGLKADGTVWAWGYNTKGQLGDRTLVDKATPVQVVLLSDVKDIAAGYMHSLALKKDGTVWAWGYSTSGQLGTGSTSERNYYPKQTKNLTDVINIYSGSSHSFALKSDGTVWTWGSNGIGELGIGTTKDVTTPVQISGISNIEEIGFGNHSTKILKKDGTVLSSGHGLFGQNGDGITSNKSVFTEIPNLTNVVKISSGQATQSFFAIQDGGGVQGWGYNKDGILNIENDTNQLSPIKIPILNSVVDIAGTSANTYVIDENKDVYTWGYRKPFKKVEIEDALGILGGLNYSMVIKSDGTVWGWGNNTFGQLGTVSNISETTPTLIPNIRVSTVPSTDSITSAFEQAETSLTQEDLNIALELINQLPDSAEKTDFLNRVNAVQTQISVNKVTELTTQAENMVNSGSVEGLDEILFQIDSITNTLPDSVERTNVVNKTNVIKTEGSKIKIDNLTQRANNLIASGNTEGLDEILLEIGSITNGLPNSPEKERVIRDTNLQSAKTAVSKAEITKTAEDIQLALDFTNKLPQSAEKVVLIERIYAVKGEPVPPMNDKTVLSSAENRLKLAETYKRDPYISNAEETVNSLYDSPEKEAMLDRLETLRTSVEDEQLQKLVKTIESKVVMAEKYKKEAYINSAREALEQLPDGAEKEAFEARLDALEEETPTDGTPSSARAVKVAVRATGRAERTPTRYSIIYADRKTSSLTDATPEKVGLVERVATLKAQYQSVIAEQNAEKAIANAVRYVELAEKYKNNYYFTKAEGLVNSLTDGDSKTTLSNRLEALRPVVYPSAEQTLIDEAVKAVESAEKYPSNTAYVSRAVKAVEILPEGQIKTNLLERVEVLTTKTA